MQGDSPQLGIIAAFGLWRRSFGICLPAAVDKAPRQGPASGCGGNGDWVFADDRSRMGRDPERMDFGAPGPADYFNFEMTIVNDRANRMTIPGSEM